MSKKYRLRFLRWLCRKLGGYHSTEHLEILHAQAVLQEKETAELRLYKHNTEFRQAALNRMFNAELERSHHG